MKIEKLSKEQEEKLAQYRDKWIKIGLDCSPCDKEKAEKLMPAIYTSQGFDAPETILWADTPLEAVELMKTKYDIDGEKERINSNFCYGQHDASWLGYYDYCDEVLGLTEECAPIKPIMEFSRNVGWFLPYDKVICICDRPAEIHLKVGEKQYHIEGEQPSEAIINGVMHHDGGPSIRWRNGESMWHLNGVKVDQEIAETPHHELDPAMLFKITNAEVRAQFVQKVGMERILEKNETRVVDTAKVNSLTYELIMFKINEEIGERPYLKMINPSVGIYHVEGVPPSVTTVAEALDSRNKTSVRPTILS